MIRACLSEASSSNITSHAPPSSASLTGVEPRGTSAHPKGFGDFGCRDMPPPKILSSTAVSGLDVSLPRAARLPDAHPFLSSRRAAWQNINQVDCRQHIAIATVAHFARSENCV